MAKIKEESMMKELATEVESQWKEIMRTVLGGSCLTCPHTHNMRMLPH